MIKEKIVISDTNIFLDLITSGMLDDFFSLSFDICTTDLVINEILLSDQKQLINHYIDSGQLKVLSYDGNEFVKILEIKGNCHTNASVPDCSVWYAAKTLGARLLTGDSKLRSVVEKDNVKVSGILYIFDNVVEYNIVSPGVAAERLEALMNINKRLPSGECMKRIDLWRVES